MTNREVGFYWVSTFGAVTPQVAHWDGEWWDFCGLGSVGYAQPDGDAVRVVSDRLIPPPGSEPQS